MNPTIRNAVEADLNIILRHLVADAMTKKNIDSEAHYAQMLSSDPESIRVLELGGMIIGCYFLSDGLYAILWRLHVVASHRKQGHGELLLQDAQRIARQRGHTQLQFIVEASNESLQKWYEALGAAKGRVWQWMRFEV